MWPSYCRDFGGGATQHPIFRNLVSGVHLYDSIAFIGRGRTYPKLTHLKRGRDAFVDPFLPGRLKKLSEYKVAPSSSPFVRRSESCVVRTLSALCGLILVHPLTSPARCAAFITYALHYATGHGRDGRTGARVGARGAGARAGGQRNRVGRGRRGRDNGSCGGGGKGVKPALAVGREIRAALRLWERRQKRVMAWRRPLRCRWNSSLDLSPSEESRRDRRCEELL